MRRCASCTERTAAPGDPLCKPCARSRDALRSWTPPPPAPKRKWRYEPIPEPPPVGSAEEAAAFVNVGLAPPDIARQLDERQRTDPLRPPLELSPAERRALRIAIRSWQNGAPVQGRLELRR